VFYHVLSKWKKKNGKYKRKKNFNNNNFSHKNNYDCSTLGIKKSENMLLLEKKRKYLIENDHADVNNHQLLKKTSFKYNLGGDEIENVEEEEQGEGFKVGHFANIDDLDNLVFKAEDKLSLLNSSAFMEKKECLIVDEKNDKFICGSSACEDFNVSNDDSVDESDDEDDDENDFYKIKNIELRFFFFFLYFFYLIITF
jgi:hypothetical protein